MDLDTDPLFRGIRQYLQDNKYGSTTAEMLWSTVARVTGLPVDKWMSSWTYQPNYPVIHVSLAAKPPAAVPLVPATPGGLAAALAAAAPSPAPFSPPPSHPPPGAPPPPTAAGDDTATANTTANGAPPPAGGAAAGNATGAPSPTPAGGDAGGSGNGTAVGGYLIVRQASVAANRSDPGSGCNGAPGGQPRWWVPLSFNLPGSKSMRWAAFDTCSAAIPLPAGQGAGELPDYVLANPGRYGYYRVNYGPELWRRVTEAAHNPKAVSAVDLAGLLDDAYQLNRLDLVGPSTFLNLTTALAARLRPEATPWGVALGVLGGWQRLLDNGALLAPDQAAQAGQAGVGGLRNGSYYAACARRLGRFTNQRLAEPLRLNLTLPGSNPANPSAPRGLNFSVPRNVTLDADQLQVRLLRPMALSASASSALAAAAAPGTAIKNTPAYAALQQAMDDNPVFAEAEDLMQDAAATLLFPAQSASSPGLSYVVHPDVRAAVYDIAVMAGGFSAWFMAQQMYEKSTLPAERDALLGALTASPDPAMLHNALLYTVAPGTRVQPQDIMDLIGGVAGQGGEPYIMAWEFVLTRTDDLLRRYGRGPEAASSASYSLGRPLKEMAKRFVSEAMMPRLEEWAAKYPGLLDSEFKATVLENIRHNRQWLKGPAVELCEWLQQQQQL